MNDVVRRVAVITGAGQGLGRAFAHALSDAGCDVVVADLNLDNATRVADELPGDTLAVQVDVSQQASVLSMRDAVMQQFGRVDALINNAGVLSTIARRPFEQIDVDEWDHVMNVNVRGIFLCCQAFSAALRSSTTGRIVNIASAEVLIARPFYVHYVASKAAVIGLTRSLAREFGPDRVTVNVVAPGSTETEIHRPTATATDIEEVLSRQSIPVRVQANDVASAVAYLASTGCVSVTGQTLVVDGGWVFN